MSKDAIIDALAHLVALLIAERNEPPEEGGWIRTRNTAYRPPKSSEGVEAPETKKHAQIGSIGAKNMEDGRGKNHPGSNQCSICGQMGVNKRTCVAKIRYNSPAWGESGWVRVKIPGVKEAWTDQRHREPITWKGGVK